MFEVWSGGQTGVDQAALRAARRAGLVTGGWAAKGWETLDGPAPWLADYGLKECPVAGYPPRTEANVRDTDLTIIFGDPHSNGSKLAIKYCNEYDITPCFFSHKFKGEMIVMKHAGMIIQEPTPENVAVAIAWVELRRLNVAGNRETSPPKIGKLVEDVLVEAFKLCPMLINERLKNRPILTPDHPCY